MDRAANTQSPTQDVATSDIVLSAYLRTCGFQLDRIEKQGNRGVFHFHDVPEEVLMQFDLGQSRAEPVELNNFIKSLTTATRRIL